MEIRKAYEIKDAKIQFVSLVDKAANKKAFLIRKADGSESGFPTYGRIVKADADSHFVTGIVYEPMVEDAQGNYMTAEEITKAAYWFSKESNKVDLQHSFEPLKGASVVESWIAKADFKIGEDVIKEGTWLMTVEIEDEEIWKSIEKGEITGFSMGGVGYYSEEDVNLETQVNSVEKAGRSMSNKNREKLSGIVESLNAFLKEFDVPKKKTEELDDKLDQLEDEYERAAQQTPAQAESQAQANSAPSNSKETPSDTQEEDEKKKKVQEACGDDEDKEKQVSKGINSEQIGEMVEKAVSKAMEPFANPSYESIEEMIEKAVEKAVQPFYQSRGISKQLDNVEKGENKERHYLADFL